jgi:hypothetical protein
VEFDPHIPWGTLVRVWLVGQDESSYFCVPLQDDGPTRKSKHPIDLRRDTFKRFAPISQGLVRVNARIVGGAKWIS